MRINPHGRKTTFRARQRTCRPQLDALYSRQHFSHMHVPPGLALAASLDTTVQSTRADVAAATVPTST